MLSDERQVVDSQDSRNCPSQLTSSSTQMCHLGLPRVFGIDLHPGGQTRNVKTDVHIRIQVLIENSVCLQWMETGFLGRDRSDIRVRDALGNLWLSVNDDTNHTFPSVSEAAHFLKKYF